MNGGVSAIGPKQTGALHMSANDPKRTRPTPDSGAFFATNYSFAVSTAMPAIAIRPLSMIQLSSVRPSAVKSCAKYCMT